MEFDENNEREMSECEKILNFFSAIKMLGL